MPPRFVSPGAEAGNAIQQFLVQRAMMERQAQLDAQAQQEAEFQRQRQEAQLLLQAQQMAEQQAARTRRTKNEDATMTANMLGVGDTMTEDQAGLMEGTPLGGLVERRQTLPSTSIPATGRLPQASDAGGAPGVIAFRGTPKQRAEAQARERQAAFMQRTDLPPSVTRAMQAREAGFDGLDPGDLATPDELAAAERRGLTRIEQEAEVRARVADRHRAPERGPVAAPEWVTTAEGEVTKRVPQRGDRPYDKGGKPEGGGPDLNDRRNARSVAIVDDLMDEVNSRTVGAGSMTSFIPGSPARNFKAKLDPLKANIAFGELQAMRDASKTGGALGAIAVRELELLESTLGSLDTAQSPAQFKEQLGKIRQSLARWESAAGGSTGAAGTAPPPKRIRYDLNGKPLPE